MKFKITDIKSKEAVKAYVDSLAEGKRFDVDIKLHRIGRSVSQNSLLHLWIKCISDETGHDKDSLHDFFKQKFLDPDMCNVFGEDVRREPTTTKLNTAQFTSYLEQIRAFAASELGIRLPDPEDQFWSEFEDMYNDKI